MPIMVCGPDKSAIYGPISWQDVQLFAGLGI